VTDLCRNAGFIRWDHFDLLRKGVNCRRKDTLINTKSSQHAKPNLARSNNCRLRINRELGKQLDQASDLLAAGNVDGARRLIHKIDTRYGGLAAPRSVDLAARLVGAD
jgi:hypothetical protein